MRAAFLKSDPARAATGSRSVTQQRTAALPRVIPDPEDAIAVPATIRARAGRSTVLPVWRNQSGGTTFRWEESGGLRFGKWSPADSPVDLAEEVPRLAWAGRYLPVPTVLDTGSDEDGSWLITAGVPGTTAVAAEWRRDPARTVTALGRALRRWHDTMPVPDCPFDASVAARLADAPGGTTDLPDPPPVDRLVVGHGDACAPNTLLVPAVDGPEVSGWVDLGRLGVADRWSDLAVATRSLDWNYGSGWQDTFLTAYGVEADRERCDYYRRLCDAGP